MPKVLSFPIQKKLQPETERLIKDTKKKNLFLVCVGVVSGLLLVSSWIIFGWKVSLAIWLTINVGGFAWGLYNRWMRMVEKVEFLDSCRRMK